MFVRLSSKVFSLVVLVVALLSTSCSDSTSISTEDTLVSETSSTEVVDGAETTVEAPTDSGIDEINGGKPEVELPDGESPADLETTDLIDGTGKTAETGDYLVMHYVGVLHENGEQFDASWDRGDTFNFLLGEGRVIQGWDDGIVGMKEGGRRLLNIPSDQAYGETERSGIPANSGLVFIVDLVSALTPPVVENAPEPVTELEVTILEEGTGEEVVSGSFVEIHYRAVLQTTGDVFASSWESGQPALFQVGATPMQTIPAWDQGLIGKRVGDTVRLVIPPGLGLNDESGEIPADATIITEVTILSVTS